MAVVKGLVRNVTYQKALDVINEYFDYDKDKALAFYLSPLEQFDNKSPFQLIKEKKGGQLMRYLQNSLMTKYSE